MNKGTRSGRWDQYRGRGEGPLHVSVAVAALLHLGVACPASPPADSAASATGGPLRITLPTGVGTAPPCPGPEPARVLVSDGVRTSALPSRGSSIRLEPCGFVPPIVLVSPGDRVSFTNTLVVPAVVRLSPIERGAIREIPLPPGWGPIRITAPPGLFSMALEGGEPAGWLLAPAGPALWAEGPEVLWDGLAPGPRRLYVFGASPALWSAQAASPHVSAGAFTPMTVGTPR